MYWWAAPSLLFVVVGIGVTSPSSSIFVVVCCCLSFIAVIWSCPSHFLKFFSIAGCQWWWYHVSWVCACPIMAGGGCGGIFTGAGGRLRQVMSFVHCCVTCVLLCRFCIVMSFPRCCVICVFLLSLLGSCGGIVVVLGWLALGGFDTTLNGGDVVISYINDFLFFIEIINYLCNTMYDQQLICAQNTILNSLYRKTLYPTTNN